MIIPDIGRRCPELPDIVADARALEKGLRAMTMKEKLEVHRKIEAENQENIEAAAAWDRCTVSEIRGMIEEKDLEMEWDEHFAFLVQLLDMKLHYAELGI